MAKPNTNDILSRMRPKRNGAETFMETMYKNKQDQEHDTKPESAQITEQFIVHNNDHVNEHENDHVKETSHDMSLETIHDTDTVPNPVPKSKSILEKYSEKKTKEDLYTRQTYLIRNDLIKRFDKAAQSRRKGFKTDVINELLENFLNENGL